jgi:hypothetical protein
LDRVEEPDDDGLEVVGRAVILGVLVKNLIGPTFPIL